MKVGVIVVDIQGDFTTLKKGSLSVYGTGWRFIKKVEKATAFLKRMGFLIFATQDWHPKDHISFYTCHEGKKPFDMIEIGERKQTLWPPHCVKGTENARIIIDNNLFRAVIKKGQHREFDSYSGFRDDGGQETELHEILQFEGIDTLLVYGIATDYCVKATALDALSYGYKVYVIEDLSRGVEKGTTELAKNEMMKAGVGWIRRFEKAILRSI